MSNARSIPKTLSTPKSAATTLKSPDVLIVGGGVIGLALAWRLRREGAAVAVVERDEPGRSCTWAAAGLLQAAPEVVETGPALLDLTLPALAMYPDFVRELELTSDLSVGFGTRGTLIVALSEAEESILDRREASHRSLGLSVERLDPTQARRKERALGPDVLAALYLKGDSWVNPRALGMALAEAVRRAGGRVHEREAVVEIMRDGGRAVGVHTESRRLDAGAVVIAAGAWSGAIEGGDDAARLTPVRGQALALDPGAGGFVRRPVWSPSVYAVPHNDGRLMIGGTIEEAGFDATPKACAVERLLTAAEALLPGARHLPFREAWAGLRPGTPDGLPILGASPAVEGLYYATGHFREGILLAPETARLLCDLLVRGERSPVLARFSPARFAGSRS